MTDTASAAPVAWRVHPFDYGIGHEGVYAMTMLEQQRDAWLRKGWKVEPLYVAPQADSQPAPDDFQPCASCFGTGVEGDADDYGRTIDVTCGECNGSGRAARAPADSVTAPAGATNTKTEELLSTTVGLLMGYREGGSRQPYKPGSVTAQVVDEVVDHLKNWPYPEPAPPAQAADSVLEDAARLDWLEGQSQVNIERVRYLGADTSIYEVTPFNSTDYNGETLRKAIDAARKQGANHD